MPTKIDIYDNLPVYDAKQIAALIVQGYVTYDELVENAGPNFAPRKRREVKALVDAAGGSRQTPGPEIKTETEEHHGEPEYTDPWESVDKNSVEALRRFIEEYPDSPHVREARKLLNALTLPGGRVSSSGIDRTVVERRIRAVQTDKNVGDKAAKYVEVIAQGLDQSSGRFTVADLQEMLRDDPNIINTAAMRRLLDEGYVTRDEVVEAGIGQEFIDKLYEFDSVRPRFDEAEPVGPITRDCTEVYFWGIPSSGKTCAMGAILSAAADGSVASAMIKDNNCQGYGYMMRLGSIFKTTNGVMSLPPGTPVTSTYVMAFDLMDRNGRYHPLTCIDLSGEVMTAMYKVDAHESLTDDQMRSLQVATSLLVSPQSRSHNRKIHFFVLEYGGEKRLYNGLTQAEYLDGAFNYINRTGIFVRDTDAIFLLITKVDNAPYSGEFLRQHLVQYINTYYPGFYSNLATLCGRYNINGGQVQRLPFSLGEVNMQDYCRFNPAAARAVVSIFLERSAGESRSRLSTLFGSLTK